jgi:hypothetical protein
MDLADGLHPIPAWLAFDDEHFARFPKFRTGWVCIAAA